MTDRNKTISSLSRLIEGRENEEGWEPVLVPLFTVRDALALLREQEPAKPRWTHPTVDKNVMMCGSCGIAIPLCKPSYCPWCGRAVKWDA